MAASGNTRLTIIGAGLMGTAIAALCAAHDYDVVLHDQNQAALDSFADRAGPIAAVLAGSGRRAEAILGRITGESNLERSVQGAFMVHEVIHEDLDAKISLFRHLDAICPADVVLATNTSSFLLSEICAGLPGRERVIGIHYVAPAHLVRAVEIITADFTSNAQIHRARNFVATIDHVGIVCRESPGFLINRLQYALKAEAQRMVEQRVASVEDIDAAVRLAIGPRLALWGPMLQEDMSARKTTVLAVTEYLHGSLDAGHFAATNMLRSMVERGHDGAMAGAGWYRWDCDRSAMVAERDRQLAQLLAWLRDHGNLAALGALGENAELEKLG